MSALRFHELTVKRVHPEAAGSVAITFDIPPAVRDTFNFQPGQFLFGVDDGNGSIFKQGFYRGIFPFSGVGVDVEKLQHLHAGRGKRRQDFKFNAYFFGECPGRKLKADRAV